MRESARETVSSGSLASASLPLTEARLELGGLTLEAGREAHRRFELRRHLRFREEIEPGYVLRSTAEATAEKRISAGLLSAEELFEIGRILFEHEYDFDDGLGSGATRAGRANPFRRVHTGRFGGPETTTCASCHWRGGPAGAGGLADNSFLYGDGDRIGSADPRNPPPLQGVGVIELLAREMSEELAATRERLVARARTTRHRIEERLSAKGTSFGILAATPDGAVDTSGVEGVDADLVVRPFGWKGTFATVREFVEESLQVHFGIQSEDLIARHARHPDPELVGTDAAADDPDGDGVRSELTSGQLTALVVFLAMQEQPVVRPPEILHEAEPAAKKLNAPTATVFTDDWTRGRGLFHDIGCASCHTPRLVLRDPVFRTRSEATGELLEIDLSRNGERPRLEHDAELGGYPVWLFSDLKRHDLGTTNASRHADHGVDPRHYLTRRLWGLASSAPYMYDGEAAWIDHAIDAHDGEASWARSAFTQHTDGERAALRVYLLSLRRERRLVVPG